jgi:phospholipid/cholesterol/gamma-HCH transport system substrate-binding protein
MRHGARHKLPNWAVGLILIVVILAASLLAYTKTLPWSHTFTVKAVFSTSQNIAVNSPVRIAGVEVGKVSAVNHLSADSSDYTAATGGSGAGSQTGGPPGRQAAVVSMEINDNGLPIHDDATMSLRPRLFLEGNLFVDLHPGTPESPNASDGHVFPESQTSVSVQLDQVLSTLQSDVRSNLQVFLHSLGDAFIKFGGANGFNQLYRTSGPAFKNTSLVNEALLGTHPNDLSGLVRNLDSTVRALDASRTELQGLIVNFRDVTGALAAHDQELSRAVSLIPGTLDAAHPAFVALNSSFPALRAFAREALPGVRSSPAALDASMPFLRQLRGLVSKPELRGLTHDLRPAIPDLTRLTQRTIPFLHQGRKLASCFNQVIIPWSNSDIPDPDPDATQTDFNHGKVFQETAYGLEGINGESRSGDGNGQYVRVLGASGTNLVSFPDPETGQTFFGSTAFPLLGARPSIQSSAKTPFRPDVRCETQQPPDINSGQAGSPPQQKTLSGSLTPSLKALQAASGTYLSKLGKAGDLLSALTQSKGKSSRRAKANAKASKSRPNASTAATNNEARSLIDAGNQAWREARRAFLSGGGG